MYNSKMSAKKYFDKEKVVKVVICYQKMIKNEIMFRNIL